MLLSSSECSFSFISGEEFILVGGKKTHFLTEITIQNQNLYFSHIMWLITLTPIGDTDSNDQ